MKRDVATITIARGMTVFMMPAIHVVMLYSKPEVYTAWWIFVLRFFAEGPGAQLFMLIMGLLVPIGRPKTGKTILKRAVILWVAGYILNFFRIYLPARLGLFDPSMLHFYHAGTGKHPFLPLLLTGDILQFAGPAYGIVQLLYKLRCRSWHLLICYLLIAWSAPMLWGLRSKDLFTDRLLALLMANDHRAFFPIFPWLCYPLAGLVVGQYYQANPNRNTLRFLVNPGLILIALGIVLSYWLPQQWEGDFYRSSPGKTIAYTGFVLVWLSGIHRMVQQLDTHHFLMRLFTFCGQHITVIYCFHWLLVGWGLAVFGYHRLSNIQSFLTAALVSILSIGLPFIYYWFHAQRQRPEAASHHLKLPYDNTSRV